MATRQPFHEYILSQLRELELTSSTLSQIRDKYGAACRRRKTANDRYSSHKFDQDRMRVIARFIDCRRAEVRAHAISCAVDILERRKALLSDEITRAVVVNALRGTFREALGMHAISGAEIARRYHDLSEAVGLTRWLRNIDLAREAALWKTREDFSEPPKLSDGYIDRIVLPGVLGYSTFQRTKSQGK